MNTTLSQETGLQLFSPGLLPGKMIIMGEN